MVTETEERDQQIAAAYSSGSSASLLSRQHGLSVSHVRAILSRLNAKKGDPKLRTPDDKVIDEAHKKLGHRLYAYRYNRLNDATQAAYHLGWSVKRLRCIEKGTSVLTLQDLQNMAGYMNISLCDLLRNI